MADMDTNFGTNNNHHFSGHWSNCFSWFETGWARGLGLPNDHSFESGWIIGWGLHIQEKDRQYDCDDLQHSTDDQTEVVTSIPQDNTKSAARPTQQVPTGEKLV